MAGTYKILANIGKGMTSQVYRAQDASGRQVAIKELLPEHRNDGKRLEGMEREAGLMAELKSPHVVNLLEYDPDRFRMVLELMPRSLRMAMQKEPFHYERRLRWAIDVSEALGHLHAKRLVHKDIKPENIFLTADDRAKLGDFGFVEGEQGLMGKIRRIFVKPRIQGTISYLSPEQVRQRVLTTQADIFSWGSVLYEMFTGRRPFAVQGESLAAAVGANGASLEILKMIKRAEPKSPRLFNKQIDPELEALILRCLMKNPHSRPDAAGVKSTLKRVLGKLA